MLSIIIITIKHYNSNSWLKAYKVSIKYVIIIFYNCNEIIECFGMFYNNHNNKKMRFNDKYGKVKSGQTITFELNK